MGVVGKNRFVHNEYCPWPPPAAIRITDDAMTSGEKNSGHLRWIHDGSDGRVY